MSVSTTEVACIGAPLSSILWQPFINTSADCHCDYMCDGSCEYHCGRLVCRNGCICPAGECVEAAETALLLGHWHRAAWLSCRSLAIYLDQCQTKSDTPLHRCEDSPCYCERPLCVLLQCVFEKNGTIPSTVQEIVHVVDVIYGSCGLDYIPFSVLYVLCRILITCDIQKGQEVARRALEAAMHHGCAKNANDTRQKVMALYTMEVIMPSASHIDADTLLRIENIVKNDSLLTNLQKDKLIIDINDIGKRNFKYSASSLRGESDINVCTTNISSPVSNNGRTTFAIHGDSVMEEKQIVANSIDSKVTETSPTIESSSFDRVLTNTVRRKRGRQTTPSMCSIIFHTIIGMKWREKKEVFVWEPILSLRSLAVALVVLYLVSKRNYREHWSLSWFVGIRHFLIAALYHLSDTLYFAITFGQR